MRCKFLKAIHWVIFGWGCLSLLGVIIIVAFAAFSMSGHHEKDDSASATDVRFVLNWCRLGDQRIEKILHSHVSARSFTGDHLDAYAIRISHLDLAELTSNSDDSSGRWYRGDQLPKVVEDAVNSVGAYGGEIPWFPEVDKLRSAEYYVYPSSIYCAGVRPIAVELIFIRPSDKMIFYLGAKT